MRLGHRGQGKGLADLDGEPFSFGHSSNLGQRVGGAAGIAAAEADARLLRAWEVGDCDHVLGRPGELYEFGKDAATSDVEREVGRVSVLRSRRPRGSPQTS